MLLTRGCWRSRANKRYDRYVFLDYGLPREKLFHCGASSKDGGNKVTTIMQIEHPEIYHMLIDSLIKKLEITNCDFKLKPA